MWHFPFVLHKSVLFSLFLFIGLQFFFGFLPNGLQQFFLYSIGFVPVRYQPEFSVYIEQFPGGAGAKLWTFFTYAFLHGDWAHLLHNMFWFVVLGNALAWRLHVRGFLALFLVGCFMGAMVHMVFHPQDLAPMIGASAGTSALTAACIRFIFEEGSLFSSYRLAGVQKFRVPAVPIKTLMRQPLPLLVIVFWFILQGYAAFENIFLGNQISPIAWQAHIGGFLAGFFLFYLVDPIPQKSSKV